jgi:hypothetical protein
MHNGYNPVHYEIRTEERVCCPKRGPLGPVSAIEERLGRDRRRSGLENREYGRGDSLRWPRDIIYPQTLALGSPTSGGHSVGIVRSRTKATEFSF